MANYTKLSIYATEEQGDIITAYLSDFPFDSFDYTDGLLNAYIPQSEFEVYHDEIENLLHNEGILDYYFEDIESQNWNAVWESNFEEVEVKNKVLIRAPFHTPRPNYNGLEVIIQPKMSFGTGHHATTQLMVEMLLSSAVECKRVLDMGSGTGVLAILAAKLGAASVDAVDIDDMADESCRENAATNGVAEAVNPILGDVRSVAAGKYDFIVANINRNILLRDMPAYVGTLNEGGVLVMSGFLEEDVEAITERALSLGMTAARRKGDGGWVALEFCK